MQYVINEEIISPGWNEAIYWRRHIFIRFNYFFNNSGQNFMHILGDEHSCNSGFFNLKINIIWLYIVLLSYIDCIQKQ